MDTMTANPWIMEVVREHRTLAQLRGLQRIVTRRRGFASIDLEREMQAIEWASNPMSRTGLAERRERFASARSEVRYYVRVLRLAAMDGAR